MRGYPTLTALAEIIALTLITVGVSFGATVIGETRHFELRPDPVPSLQSLTKSYRRPDTIPFPVSNPYTPAKAALGRVLFHDPRLSGIGALSCASCHNPGFSYGDGRATGLGERMNPLNRRSPSVVNSAWGKLFMWDGRAATLEAQVAGPIENIAEMNQLLDTLVTKINDLAAYRSLFSAAFPQQPITAAEIANAIATYERTIVSTIAPFDNWVDGDETAVTEAAKRGFALFNGKAKCAACHGGWLFTDDGFHDIGLPDHDVGRGELFPKVLVMQHAFKTPSLRETARRGPYMHDGSLPTLEAVIGHYDQGGTERPSKSELVTPLGLSPQEQADIVAFLQTLTSDIRLDTAPVFPR